jgi:metallo-beta-lactamase class B
MQILKNLFQVSGDLNGLTFDQPGALWNDGNAYVLKTPQGLILFDCGCGETIEQLFDNMRYWDLAPDEIQYCLLTHAHLDQNHGRGRNRRGHCDGRRTLLWLFVP